jgi:D-alanyl-D-alanine carboxypeptidase
MWRLILTRGVRLVRIGLCCVALGAALVSLAGTAPAAARANPKYASIVVDANSNKVLYSRNADGYRYPASLTKLMTLYLTFANIQAGKLSLADKLTVSRHAAAQAPSKLGLKPGQKISVRDCIKAIVTKSANDVAVVLAEGQASSETRFAQLMTEKAHQLGMMRTTFKNASGLPNRHQRTTARDLSVLAQALMHDFPEYFHYFSTPSFTWHGRKYPNHDHLLGSYAGTTGMKTGYTAASGFNLVTSVDRRGYKLVGVVLGGRTARSRDKHMKRLLDLQFARLRREPLLASRDPLMSRMPDPRQRPDEQAIAEAAQEAGSAGPDMMMAANDMPALANRDRSAGNAARAALGPTSVQVSSVNPKNDPIGDAIAALSSNMPTQSALATADDPPGGVQTAALQSDGSQGDADDDDPIGDSRVMDWLGHNEHWGIQIGAFAAMESAAARLSAAAALAPKQLGDATPAIVTSVDKGSTLYRARFGPFDKQSEADAACKALTKRGIHCVAVKDTEGPVP